MSGRVSIKGTGASIFFGEDDSAEHPEKTRGARDDAEARSRPGAQASRHSGAAAPRNERANEPPSPRSSDHQEVRAFFGSLVLPESLRHNLRAMSREEHPFHTSVRLSREEMLALRDLCYELEATMGIEVNRNDVTRVALRLLLEDYAIRKKESVLVQVLKEEDQY